MAIYGKSELIKRMSHAFVQGHFRQAVKDLVDSLFHILGQKTVKVYNEIPAGTVNGTNKIFTLEFLPLGDVALTLYPAIRLHPNDFTIDEKIITLAAGTIAPVDNECLIADYEHKNE